jgi:hypothetical protein
MTHPETHLVTSVVLERGGLTANRLIPVIKVSIQALSPPFRLMLGEEHDNWRCLLYANNIERSE